MSESKPTIHKPRVSPVIPATPFVIPAKAGIYPGIRKSECKTPTRDGLPNKVRLIDIKEAFAIVGDPKDPETWQLPHHTRAIFRSTHGQVDKEKLALHVERTVDWKRMPAAVAALSRYGYQGVRVKASPEEIIHAARHLAEHYRKAGLSVPDTLGALI